MMKKTQFPIPIRKQTLAEQVASSIREAILDERWQPGETLPTEPELAEAFDVSRAVIRDATRMLAAQGLVVAKHGRGVFVTESQVEAFGDALLLALRRDKATVWDMEQFEQMVFPEVCALAAKQVTQEEMAQLRTLAADYIELFENLTSVSFESQVQVPKSAHKEVADAFIALIEAIFLATHNAMWQILARPILSLRSMRRWETEEQETSPDLFIALENQFVDTLIGAIASGDPKTTRDAIMRLMRLPREAESAMRQTPIGKIPYIYGVQRPSADELTS